MRIIIVGRGHSGTRIPAATLAESGVNMGNVNSSHDHIPAFAMYAAVRDLGKMVTSSDGVWDFSAFIDSTPTAAYKEHVAEYLAYFEGHTVYGWKLPESVLGLPWLVQLFPDAYYIHWVRDGRDNILDHHGTDNLSRFSIPDTISDDRLRNAAISWAYHEALVEATPKTKHWLTLYYEDFVLNQEESLTVMSNYLNMTLFKIAVNSSPIGRYKTHDLNGVLPIMASQLERHGYL